nr:unnamed protein product [Haemonchus contortus]
MRLLGQAVLLITACYGLDEKDIPKHLRKNFDENKLILPATREYGEEFYANLTTRAFTAVLRSLAKERWRSLAEELMYYRNHSEKQNRLSAMLSSGNNVPFVQRNVDGTVRDSTGKDHEALKQLNAFLAQGVKLAASAAGNVVGNKTVRLLSPRIGNTKHTIKEVIQVIF